MTTNRKTPDAENAKGVSASEQLRLECETDITIAGNSQSASPDCAKLWELVRPGAQWRPCDSCGPVARPRLIVEQFRNGTKHIKATCPHCSSYLGHLTQRSRPKPKPGPLPEQNGLWGQVATDATWGPCPVHGVVKRPQLWPQVTKGGRQNIQACCVCGRFLGFVRQQPTYVAEPHEVREATYKRYLVEAETLGHRPGQAYHRYLARYGTKPAHAWQTAGGVP